MISFLLTFWRFFNGIRKGSKDPEFRGLLFLIVLLLASGTFFYSQIEGWRPFDSLYFSVTTLVTVGYGDFHPKTDLGKAFTMIYILLGVGALLGFVDLIARHTRPEDPLKHFVNNNGKVDADKKED